MLRAYFKFCEWHKVRLQAKVATFIAEVKKVQKREKTDATDELARPKNGALASRTVI